MKRLAAALVACTSLGAAADDNARWYLQLDNDLFFDTDRWYSSGLRLARVQSRGGYELELGVLQEVYTPETKRFRFGVIDRAPAARLLLSAARHDRSPRTFQTLELALGVRGPAALGRQVTDFIHRFVAASDIVWSRQEPNRFDGQLAAVRTHPLEWVNVHYGAVLGNQIAFAHAGAEIRIGARGAATTPALRYAATPPWSTMASHGWGGFTGASVRVVARNEMVERPYSAFGDALERRNAVGRAVAGLAWSRPGIAATLALVQESREFDGQRASHRFGSFTVHADF